MDNKVIDGMNGYCDLSWLKKCLCPALLGLYFNNNYDDGMNSKVIGGVYILCM